jgi:crotonobetainyl-CoA hydratase
VTVPNSPPEDDLPVLVEVREHTLLITINRPRVMNSINAAATTGIADALERANADREIRVVVITGAGERSFCAGADLKALSRGESFYPAGYEHFGFAGYVTHFISKPTIAAVNGFALGGGTEITLASDLAVAADTATFGLPEVKRGIVAGAGGAFRLPQQVPWKVGLEMIFTGDPIDAETALRYGLVNRVVGADKVLDTALELAGRIAVNAPLSVQTSKRLAYGAVDGTVTDEAARWSLNESETAALMASADAREGPRAFAEKREPVWQSR